MKKDELNIKIGSFEERTSEKGFTLVETLFVFVIVGILLGVLYAIFGPTLSGAKAEGQATQSSSDAVGIQKVYQGRYTGLTTLGVIQLPNVLPAKMVTGTGAARQYINTWGGLNTFTPSNFTGVTDAGFVIQHAGVPKSDCVSFATELAKRFKRVDVGGTTAADSVKAYGGELNVPTLATKCDAVVGTTTVYAYYN